MKDIEMNIEPVPLTDKEFERVARFARDRFALSLDPTKKSMVFRRLCPRLKALGLPDFDTYLSFLEKDSAEANTVLPLLTTNLTHFFREKHHFDTMRTEILPAMVQRLKKGGRARIWSCACSSGQEPYSLAMEALRFFPEIGGTNFGILATDIDPVILEAAQKGVYSVDKIEGIPPDMKTNYLKKAPDGMFDVAPQVKSLISFAQLNLASEWPFTGKFDVIFCRNVAIYFDPPTQKKLWARLIDRLEEGALLCIGHSEIIPPEISGSIRKLGRTAYQKTGANSAA